MKKLVLIALVLANACVSALAQTSYPQANYQPLAITLPVSTLTASLNTNFANGWTNTTIYTNTSITYSQSSAAFVTNTTTTTNVQVIYSAFPCGQQKDVALQCAFKPNNSQSNLLLTLGRSVIYGQPDTANNFVWTNYCTYTNSSGYSVNVTNIPASYVAGFGYVYVLNAQWTDAGIAASNLSLFGAIEKNAP